MICPSNVLLRQIYSDLIISFVQICDYCYEDYMEKVATTTVMILLSQTRRKFNVFIAGADTP